MAETDEELIAKAIEKYSEYQAWRRDKEGRIKEYAEYLRDLDKGVEKTEKERRIGSSLFMLLTRKERRIANIMAKQNVDIDTAKEIERGLERVVISKKDLIDAFERKRRIEHGE
jgi:hypothetical protein